jgi:hypothetical protein
VNPEPTLLEILASLELQEQHIAQATKDSYILPEDLLNCAGDTVDQVQRYQSALVSHPYLATMPVPALYELARDKSAPFTRMTGPSSDRELTIADVLAARKIPAVALPAIYALRRALQDHPHVIKEAPSWAALVRESVGWAAIRQATRNYLDVLKSPASKKG